MNKDDVFKILQFIDSLALDCSQHLKEQHNQNPNDKPRFYFDSIAKQVEDWIKEIEGV